MINYSQSFNIYENFNNPESLLLDKLKLPSRSSKGTRKQETSAPKQLTRNDNYSVVRRPRMCSGDVPTNPDNEEEKYELAKYPFAEDIQTPERPTSDPYLPMCDANRSQTLTKQSSKIHDLDDGYQAIRSEDDDHTLAEYELMSGVKDLRVSLPASDPKRQSGLSDGSTGTPTPTNRDSGSVFVLSGDSSSKDENLYAPFPVSDSQNSITNMDGIPSVPPPRSSGSDSPKSSPEKPTRHKKGMMSPPSAAKNSKEAETSKLTHPIPPPLDSIPVRKNLQDTSTQNNTQSCAPHSKPGEHQVPSLSDSSRLDDPDKGNYYSVQPLPPRRKNIPPPTDYAYVTPKAEDKPEIPLLPPPRRQVSQKQEKRGVSSPPQQSFRFQPGRSDPSTENQSDSDEYEDATMMNGQPPRPPPRGSKRPSLNKSQSCHSAEQKAQFSQDDIPVRPKSKSTLK
jgi:hypothetical protein